MCIYLGPHYIFTNNFNDHSATEIVHIILTKIKGFIVGQILSIFEDKKATIIGIMLYRNIVCLAESPIHTVQFTLFLFTVFILQVVEKRG